MKTKFNLFLAIIVLAFVTSCNNQPTSQSESTQPANEENVAKECTYSYEAASTKIKWTAFKTTARVGVGGAFDKFKVVPGTPTAGSASDLLKGATFEIETSSTNTANPERDKKIVDHFFGTMTNGNIISGKIKSLNGDDKTGSAMIDLSINGVEQEITGEYKIDDANVVLNATVDMADWEALASIDSLNQVCYDLHKGEDGISKLWPDVAVEITTTLGKDCQ